MYCLLPKWCHLRLVHMDCVKCSMVGQFNACIKCAQIENSVSYAANYAVLNEPLPTHKHKRHWAKKCPSQDKFSPLLPVVCCGWYTSANFYYMWTNGEAQTKKQSCYLDVYAKHEETLVGSQSMITQSSHQCRMCWMFTNELKCT